MRYLYIAGTIVFTVYGQLILKWRISQYGPLPPEWTAKILFMSRLFGDIYILSGFGAAFVASLFWVAAMTKFDVSYAYPFMSLAFVLVTAFSTLVLHEPFTIAKAIGLTLIVAGIVVTSRSI
ncbi:MAG: EamA family transporter [Curvibacter sp.]|nr:EamA family transporter [Curvibacter sp.]